MPSRGKDLHAYLKEKAGIKILKMYGEQIDFIKYEQPQNNCVVKEQNYFKVRVTLGSDWHDSLEVENLNFPDMLVQVNLTDEEKKHMRSIRKDAIPDKKIIVVECETTSSPLVTSKATPRYHAYKLIKEKHKYDVIFVLVTFKDIKVKTDLFDRVWWFKHP